MNYFYNNFLSLDKINEVYDTIFNIDFPFFYAHENTVSKPDLNKEENIKATTETYNCPHTDTDKPHLAAIYYVNDSDGFTFLFDNNNNIINRIVPKKGSLLLFDGSIKHASGHPIKSLKRCVINFNLTKW